MSYGANYLVMLAPIVSLVSVGGTLPLVEQQLNVQEWTVNVQWSLNHFGNYMYLLQTTISDNVLSNTPQLPISIVLCV